MSHTETSPVRESPPGGATDLEERMEGDVLSVEPVLGVALQQTPDQTQRSQHGALLVRQQNAELLLHVAGRQLDRVMQNRPATEERAGYTRLRK